MGFTSSTDDPGRLIDSLMDAKVERKTIPSTSHAGQSTPHSRMHTL